MISMSKQYEDECNEVGSEPYDRELGVKCIGTKSIELIMLKHTKEIKKVYWNLKKNHIR